MSIRITSLLVFISVLNNKYIFREHTPDAKVSSPLERGLRGVFFLFASIGL
jgi:hypothetical protein